jgi:hypothetical protein
MLEEDINGEFFSDCPLSQALMIRHPIARHLSMYRFFQRAYYCGRLEEYARTATARDFVLEMMENHPQIANDSQVVYLALGGKYTPPCDRDLEIAVARIRRISLIGVVERYAETMVCGEYFLSPSFPNIDLCAKPLNVTNGRSFDEQDILERAEAILGADVLRHLLIMNSLDIRLWRSASAELDRRIQLLPKWEEKLKAFDARDRSLLTASQGWKRVAWPETARLSLVG